MKIMSKDTSKGGSNRDWGYASYDVDKFNDYKVAIVTIKVGIPIILEEKVMARQIHQLEKFKVMVDVI